MKDFLAALLDPAITLFAVASMLSVGLANTLSQIIGPLRDVPAVIRAVTANFVLVPALAYIVIWILPLAESLEDGLILIAAAAGAPFLIKLSEFADLHLGLTATLLVLLLPITIIYMPLVVPLLLPGTDVGALAIATPLVLTMLLPLAVGLLVRSRWSGMAGRFQPIIAKVSTVALIAFVLLTILLNFDSIIKLGLKAIVAAAAVVVGAFVLGYWLGGGVDPDGREILGLGTGQRNIGAATVVASQSLADPAVVTMIVVTSLIGLAVLFPIARLLRQRERQRLAQREAPASRSG